MSVRVLRAGILSTLQDLGRYGYQRYGVPVGGVMDEISHRLANLLVGNAEGEATLEITLSGPSLVFEQDALVALTGGEFPSTVNGAPVPVSRPLLLRAGSTLDIGPCRQGCRAYLAVAGGWSAAPVMGSRSTYLRGGFGGFEGRALKRGDALEYGNVSDQRYPGLRAQLNATHEFAVPHWSIKANTAFLAHSHHRIRFIPGRHWELFAKDTQQQFCASEYRIAPNSDRMGYRLQGPVLSLALPADTRSEAVTFGSIQVPPDGLPIVLMANRQTTGGYPRIGEVTSMDLPLLAQLPPGDTLRFETISLEDSQRLYLERERELDMMRQGIALRIRQ